MEELAKTPAGRLRIQKCTERIDHYLAERVEKADTAKDPEPKEESKADGVARDPVRAARDFEFLPYDEVRRDAEPRQDAGAREDEPRREIEHREIDPPERRPMPSSSSHEEPASPQVEDHTEMETTAPDETIMRRSDGEGADDGMDVGWVDTHINILEETDHELKDFLNLFHVDHRCEVAKTHEEIKEDIQENHQGVYVSKHL